MYWACPQRSETLVVMGYTWLCIGRVLGMRGYIRLAFMLGDVGEVRWEPYHVACDGGIL